MACIGAGRLLMGRGWGVQNVLCFAMLKINEGHTFALPVTKNLRS